MRILKFNNFIKLLLCLLGHLQFSTSSNITCVTVTLYDTFADGWGDAMWYIETPKTPISPAAPTCTENPLVKHICGEKGQFYMMVLNGDDGPPDNFWEIFWTVRIDSTGELFSGGFNTTMVFDYSNNKWTLIHYHNLWPNEQTLTTCGSSEYVSSQSCLPQPGSPGSSLGLRNGNDKKIKQTASPVSDKVIGRKGVKRTLGMERVRATPAKSMPTTRPTKLAREKVKKEIPDVDSATGAAAASAEDTSSPTVSPSALPTHIPTLFPTPTFAPSPTNETRWPTGQPSSGPTGTPTAFPTSLPTAEGGGGGGGGGGGAVAVERKKRVKKVVVVQKPNIEKAAAGGAGGGGGTEYPTGLPSPMPTHIPTVFPTFLPTGRPSSRPTFTYEPTPVNETRWPTGEPTDQPTGQPTDQPTDQPTGQPTDQPTSVPSSEGGGGGGGGGGAALIERRRKRERVVIIKKEKKDRPVAGAAGGGGGGGGDTDEPTAEPTVVPTYVPTFKPTYFPTPENMTRYPSGQPSGAPTADPTSFPTSVPTGEIEGMGDVGVQAKEKVQKQKIVIEKKEKKVITAPAVSGAAAPTTSSPSHVPTVHPSAIPSVHPSALPSFFPTGRPSSRPTFTYEPTPVNETRWPTGEPTDQPTGQPTDQPTDQPTGQPTDQPTSSPTVPGQAVGGAALPKLPEKKPPIKFERTPAKAVPVKPVEATCAAELKVTLQSPDGEGWYSPDYLGTMFYISDETKKKLIAYGTLEEGSFVGSCEYCFGEGSYYFRVSADNIHHNARWSFCGTTGSFSEQLSFHIENCECVPDALLDLDMVCEESFSTVVTVSGKFSVNGFQSEIFNKVEQYVVAETLAATVSGWEADNIKVDGSNVNMISTGHGKRSLVPYSIEVSFEVTFVPEIAYEYEGMSYNGLEELVGQLGSILEESVTSGEFLQTLKAYAIDAGDRQLSRVNNIEIDEYVLNDVTYVGTKNMELLSEGEEEYSWQSFSSVGAKHVYSQYYHGLILGVILSIGVIVFIGALGHSLRARRYENLISKFVDPAESDFSLSTHSLTSTSPLNSSNHMGISNHHPQDASEKSRSSSLSLSL